MWKRNLGSQETHFPATEFWVPRWFVWLCLGWLVPRPSPMKRSVFFLHDWSLYVTGLSDESRWVTPYTQQHSTSHIAFTPRELEKRKDRRKSGETTHPLSILGLSWSLRLGLYIGLAPTVWEPSIFLREERVHGDQNVGRSWLCKSNTSALCVNWLYTLAEILGNT